jgi:hypothetical protein
MDANEEIVCKKLTKKALALFYKYDINPAEAMTILNGIRIWILHRICDISGEEAANVLAQMDAEDTGLIEPEPDEATDT